MTRAEQIVAVVTRVVAVAVRYAGGIALGGRIAESVVGEALLEGGAELAALGAIRVVDFGGEPAEIGVGASILVGSDFEMLKSSVPSWPSRARPRYTRPCL